MPPAYESGKGQLDYYAIFFETFGAKLFIDHAEKGENGPYKALK